LIATNKVRPKMRIALGPLVAKNLGGMNNMTTKAELIQLDKSGELPLKAVASITNTTGAAILEIIHGIDDKVFGYLFNEGNEEKTYFFVKIRYDERSNWFKVGELVFNLDEFIRVN
jgi:hypothetical protein